MYVLKINNTKYKSFASWNEIRLRDAEVVYSIVMPEKLRNYYELLLLEQTEEIKSKINAINFTVEELEKEFPLYYGNVICALSNIPEQVMELTPRVQREELYRYKSNGGTNCISIVMGLMKFPFDFEPQGLKQFEWQGETLLMPETKRILGIDRPLTDETAITFCETADLIINIDKVKQGKYKSLANIVSILCRPAGEVYNEVKSLARAETMSELTMNIVWEVFFCLIPAKDMLDNILQTFLKEAGLQERKQVSVPV